MGSERKCSVEGCLKPHHAKAYCYFHYMRAWYGSPVQAPVTDKTRFTGRECIVFHCPNRAGGLQGLCKSHGNWAGKYGFSVAQAIQIINSGYPCDVCGVTLNPTNINVDHDHECCPGQGTCGFCVRGLLCRSCNRGIGSFNEQVELVERAAAYLKGVH